MPPASPTRCGAAGNAMESNRPPIRSAISKTATPQTGLFACQSPRRVGARYAAADDRDIDIGTGARICRRRQKRQCRAAGKQTSPRDVHGRPMACH